MKKFYIALAALAALAASALAIASTSGTDGLIDYAITSVTSSAWTQVIPAANVKKAIKGVYVFNSGTYEVYLGFGGSGSEVAQIVVPGGMTVNGGNYVPLVASQSTRISIKSASVGNSDSTGKFLLSVLYN